MRLIFDRNLPEKERNRIAQESPEAISAWYVIRPFEYRVIDLQSNPEYDRKTTSKRVIPVGTTSLLKSLQWGLVDPELFTVFYNERFNTVTEDHLNCEAQYAALDVAQEWSYGVPMFIRPEGDTKEFDGQILPAGRSIGEHLKTILNTATSSTMICVSRVQQIEEEWRLFFVGGRFVTGSQYKSRGTLFTKRVEQISDIPAHRWVLAALSRCRPAPTMAVDVCRTVKGELKIVEYSCINCAGWYDSDISKLFSALQRL